jgi:hypothetical protein
VARNKVRVALDASIHERALASRETLDRMLERNEVIYGVNIGFGGNVKFLIPPSAIAVHQQGMLRLLCPRPSRWVADDRLDLASFSLRNYKGCQLPPLRLAQTFLPCWHCNGSAGPAVRDGLEYSICGQVIATLKYNKTCATVFTVTIRACLVEQILSILDCCRGFNVKRRSGKYRSDESMKLKQQKCTTGAE